jgi:hypothetical protein
MKTIRKEIIYTMPYSTAADIRRAEQKRNRLYEKYNSVKVYPNGISEVKIVATNL